jgi:hypothetical protein
MRLAPERESQRICESKNLGHGVVPTVFWGKRFCQGQKRVSFKGLLHRLEPDDGSAKG